MAAVDHHDGGSFRPIPHINPGILPTVGLFAAQSASRYLDGNRFGDLFPFPREVALLGKLPIASRVLIP
jgi:hypothetical protein